MAEKSTKEIASVDVVLDAKVETDKAVAPTGVDTFAVGDLIARSSDFLGCPSYVAAGALYGASEDLSIDDAKNRVTNWLKQPVEEA